MKLAVLAHPDTWHFRDLQRAAGQRHELIAIDYASIFSVIQKGAQKIKGYRIDGDCFDLESADAVLVRAMPAGSLEQVVFRMDLLGRLSANGTPVVNSPRSIEAAVDKYLSLALMRECGIRIPDTVVCQSGSSATLAFEQLGGDVLSKPIFGSQGRGIVRLDNPAAAREHFESNTSGIFYLQRFVDHGGQDLRVMVIGDRTTGMRRSNSGHWLTNASHGATCAPAELSDDQRNAALAAAKAVGASYAGVDIIEDRLGNNLVVEVNACPGWRALKNSTGLDVAGELLELIADISNSENKTLSSSG
ncbi:MAG: RimK family alpha-L-glutamate ligase [Planctomycetota bacterium]